MSDKMLFVSKREGELLRALKWALTGTELFIISVDGRNTRLPQILECFNPIFSTKDTIEAGYFTAKLFPDVEVLIDEEPQLQPPEESEAASNNLANLVAKLKEENVTIIVNDDNGECEKENQQKVKEEQEKESKSDGNKSSDQLEEVVQETDDNETTKDTMS